MKSIFNALLGIVGIGMFITGILAIVHLINLLLTKGTIWIMYELFNINWYGKFWPVYVALIIVSVVLKQIITIKR